MITVAELTVDRSVRRPINPRSELTWARDQQPHPPLRRPPRFEGKLIVIKLLNWLTARHTPLGALSPADLDQWQATGTSTRELAGRRFLRWAIKARLVDGSLTMTPHRRGTSPRLSGDRGRRGWRVVPSQGKI